MKMTSLERCHHLSRLVLIAEICFYTAVARSPNYLQERRPEGVDSVDGNAG